MPPAYLPDHRQRHDIANGSCCDRQASAVNADRWLPDNLNAQMGCGRRDREAWSHFGDFHQSEGKPGLASARTWSPSDADDIARHCAGAAVLGTPRWRFKDGEGHPVLLPTEVNRFPTEVNRYEGALSRTLGLSTFVLVQRDVLRRVVFAYNFGGYVGEFPPDAEVDWLHKDEFLVPFGYWKAQLEERRDISWGTAAAQQLRQPTSSGTSSAWEHASWTGRERKLADRRASRAS
jgi:hypothetical protein